MKAPQKIASWVIVDLKTGAAVSETYNQTLAQMIDTRLYRAVPIMEYLQDLNFKIRMQSKGK